MRFRNATASRRAGFTLIELLVVMAVIATLVALTVGAVFKLRDAQVKNFTEVTIEKLASALDQQWKAAIDQIREETVPQSFLTLAGNDARRAKSLYMKARLKQEFPVSFYEAVYPAANYTPGQNGAYQIPPANVLKDLPPKGTYVRAIGTNVPAMGAPIPLPQDWESSAMLFLALSQGRRGQVGFNPDEHVEPSAIQTRVANGQTFKIFVDAWGNPLRFYAFPFNNAELNDPANNYVSRFGQNMQSPDPLDPDRTLANYVPPLATPFQNMVHPTTGKLRMLIPVIGSAGRDGLWGDTSPATDYFLMPAAPTADADDNIYSYRLRRSGQKGD